MTGKISPIVIGKKNLRQNSTPFVATKEQSGLSAVSSGITMIKEFIDACVVVSTFSRQTLNLNREQDGLVTGNLSKQKTWE